MFYLLLSLTSFEKYWKCSFRLARVFFARFCGRLPIQSNAVLGEYVGFPSVTSFFSHLVETTVFCLWVHDLLFKCCNIAILFITGVLAPGRGFRGGASVVLARRTPTTFEGRRPCLGSLLLLCLEPFELFSFLCINLFSSSVIMCWCNWFMAWLTDVLFFKC